MKYRRSSKMKNPDLMVILEDLQENRKFQVPARSGIPCRETGESIPWGFEIISMEKNPEDDSDTCRGYDRTWSSYRGMRDSPSIF